MKKRGIMIAGTNSGCGKTTITTALLKALIDEGYSPAAFKCGPDYIDPMYHKKALGVPSYNLDPYFCDKKGLIDAFEMGFEGRDIAVVEGVMGYYDGYGSDSKASTWEVADKIDVPVILVVNAKGMGESVAALLSGFKNYKKTSHIVGVIFNNIKKGMYSSLCEHVKKIGIEPLGYMEYDENLVIGSRHLGLLTADEVNDIKRVIDLLGQRIRESVDIQRIVQIADEYATCSESMGEEYEELKKAENGRIVNENGRKYRIAIANDNAFCFIYEANLKILEKMGCEIVSFSPLEDNHLPGNIDGLILPGGYPELYLEKLAKNTTIMLEIKSEINNGLPTIAECGGFMYLHEKIDGYKMVGIIPGKASKKERLVRFGYAEMASADDSMLLMAGESIRIHEFHYYDSDNNGEDYLLTKASNGNNYREAHASDTLYAGYPHIYLPANEKVVTNYMNAVATHNEQRTK